MRKSVVVAMALKAAQAKGLWKPQFSDREESSEAIAIAKRVS